MINDIDILTIHNYLAGQLEAAESSQVESRLQTDPEFAEALHALKIAWEASEGLQVEITSDQKARAFDMLSKQLTDKSPAQIKRLRMRRRFIAIAASIIVIVLAGFLLFRMMDFSNSEQTITAGDVPHAFHLPDGSRIILDKGSELSYKRTFNRNSRKVRLLGEASFEIVPVEGKSFIVETEKTETTVLGTKFIIQAHSSGENTVVYVQEGHVRFSPIGSSKYLDLSEGQVAGFNAGNSVLQRMTDFNVNSIAWLTRTLKFEETPMRKVFADLETQFKVQIDTGDADILDCRLNGTFRLDIMEIIDILQTLQLSFQFELEQSNAFTWKITGGICN